MHSPDTRLRSRLHSLDDCKPSILAVLFVLLIAIASIPVLTHALPPLSDYINHLGRTYIINHIDSDPHLARYYFTKWQILPNLMIDLVMLVLNPFMDIYRAGQVFTISVFVLTLSGTLALNRALHGHWSALPFIATPLLYNEVMLVGVMNYIFGVGLALWALAAWVALRERQWPWRLAVSTLFAVALFFCHLYAVGFYGLVVLAFELHRLWSKRDQPLPPRLWEFFSAGLPFIPVIALLCTSPTWTAASTFAWTIGGKLDGVFFAVDVYYPAVAVGLVACAAAAGVWARRRGMLRFHQAGWVILAVGAVTYLAMPRALFAAYMADQRLPIALAFVLIACFHVEFRHAYVRRAFLAMVLVMLAARVIEVQVVWDRLAIVSAEFQDSVKLIERGARVLVVHGDRSNGAEISDYELVHAASLATIERSALVSTTFTVRGKQLLGVRDAYRNYVETEDRTPPSVGFFVQAAQQDMPYFFTRWPQHFDYVYILFTKHEPNPDRKFLRQLFDGSTFQLYQVVKPN